MHKLAHFFTDSTHRIGKCERRHQCLPIREICAICSALSRMEGTRPRRCPLSGSYGSRRSQVMSQAWRLLQGLGFGAGVGFAAAGANCRWSRVSW